MRIYLAVTFWGEEYRRYFLDFCLASLLAPGNIPAITDKTAARLLIATNDRDWAALQSEPSFVAAKRLISIEQVAFDNAAYSTAHEKMLVMSEAHKRLARRMFEDRAHGVFIYPDMIAATGFVSKLEELSRNGAAVVMFMNVRFANEGLIGEIKEQGLVRRGEPIAISSKELARLTLRHMHSEMRRSGFENNYNDYGCSSYFWVVAPEEELLFHCGCWIPSLIDYGAITKHDETTFESCTLDGDYVAKNLADSRRVHFVRDTSELFMISFTPESTVSYSLAPYEGYRLNLLRTALKIRNAHQFLYKQGTLDWLTKDQFRLPVRFRGGNAPEFQWRYVERRAARIIGRMEQGGSLSEKIVYCCYNVLKPIFIVMKLFWMLWIYRRDARRQIGQMLRGNRAAWKEAANYLLRPGQSTVLTRCIVTFGSYWNNRAIVIRRTGQMLRGDRVAWRRAKWRFRQSACQLLGRPLCEPEPESPR